MSPRWLQIVTTEVRGEEPGHRSPGRGAGRLRGWMTPGTRRRIVDPSIVIPGPAGSGDVPSRPGTLIRASRAELIENPQ